MGGKTTGAKLEREAVKRYLQQYHAAKQKKRILEERRRTLSADLRGPSTPAYRVMPSSRPVHPDGAGAVVFQIAEVEERIEAQQAEMAKLGFSADGMFQLLQSGADSTAWNLDKVGDAVKEFSIRAIDGSDTTVDAFEALGYNAATMMDTFAAGGDGANQAFFDVLNTLMDMEDQVARDAMGVSLFGTMWEDLGTEAMEAMANASAGAYDTMDAMEQINAIKYNDLGTALEGVKRQAEAVLVRIGKQLAPYAKEGLEYLANNVLRQKVVDTINAWVGATKGSAKHLAAINGIRNKNLIRVGQVIYLTEAAAAVAKLAKLGVINSPDYWQQAAASGKVKYLDCLLIQAAEKITKAGTRTATPEEGVAALVAAGVVNTPDYWLANYRTFPSLDALLCALGGAVK